MSKLFVIAALAMAALAPAQQQAALQARVETLQAKIESVESIRAIKRLQYAYGHYTELGLWNDFADLFTDDAITNYSQGARGKAEVRKLFFDQVGQGKLGLADGRIYPHILFQPVITLAPDGRTAKGRWRILAMLGGLGGSATWYSGVYENEYVMQDGVWKISNLRSEPRATAAYTAAGWKDSGIHVPTHYTDPGLAIPYSAKASTDATPLAARVGQLEQRAARLNDQAQVTNLLDTYGYAMDRRLWNEAAALFADNATLELGQQGVYAGKASIRRALDQFGPQGNSDYRSEDLREHIYLQTVVSVSADGRTANARGTEFVFSSSPGELSEGVFENTFVKQGNAWKIQSVHFYPRMIVDAAMGWAKSSKPAPGPSKQFPPDRPPTSVYEIYPKFAVAPFHFDNPVTGRPPQYPAGVPSAVRSATATPMVRNTSDVATRLSALERNVAAAETYDIAENLLNARGYAQDDAPPVFADQILQPVIDIAADGKSAKIRARQLDLNGTSGEAGFWSAASFEGELALESGAWKFKTARWSPEWSAKFPGGWASK